MTPEEAKVILSVYREGGEDTADPFFAEALKLAADNPDLAKWFAAEKALDTAIAGKLNTESVPHGLKDALISTLEPRNTFEWTWPRAMGLAAAAAAVTLLLSLSMAHPREKGDTVENFRAEMVNFVNLDPPLEMQSGDLQKIQERLAQTGSLASMDVPEAIQKLPALGCRSFLFRGYKVGLICFRRDGNQLAHLLVVDSAAFGEEPLPAGQDFRREGDWMTATWIKNGKLYVLATKGDETELKTLLASNHFPLLPLRLCVSALKLPPPNS